MENRRRLSPVRVFIATFTLVIIAYACFWFINRSKEIKNETIASSWFAPYVDVTSTPRFAFEQLGGTPNQKNIILSFIVSSHTDPCTPSWGANYSLDDASTKLDLDRRIARFRQLGGNISISFGGLLNDELAVNCVNKDALFTAYTKVISRYEIDTIDFDIEGNDLTNINALKRRAEVIASLQKEQRSQGKNLAVWLTLPVAPQGLTQDGTNAIAEMLAAKVDIAGINVMTMDYEKSLSENESMEKGSEDALNETHRQLGILFKNAGIYLNSVSLWAKIGATPMIGQNDTINQIFTLNDANKFNEFAITNNIARMSMWSANRDVECGENYVNISVVSDSCSGVKQDKYSFANTLSKGFEGKISNNASLITAEDPETIQKPDNPANSPYQIWTESGTYLEGTKVVWHQNVYEAKWWTEGDLPDNPVLQSWQTPWQLIGPVLPGERPIPQPTLAPGTYPEWSGSTIYDEGNRVLFNGTPYQAKWWTQGDSPAASTSNPDSSPWKVLNEDNLK